VGKNVGVEGGRGRVGGDFLLTNKYLG